MDAGTLIVGLLKNRYEVDDRATEARQVGAIVDLVTAILHHEFGLRRHAVAAVVGAGLGKIVARHGAADVGAMALVVPLVVADAAVAVGLPQKVDGDHLALRHLDRGAAAADVDGRLAIGRVPEITGVDVDTGVEHRHDLSGSEQAAIKKRGGGAGGSTLADQDRAVIFEHLAAFELEPKNHTHFGEGLPQAGDFGFGEQQADARKTFALGRAFNLFAGEFFDIDDRGVQVGIGEKVDHHHPQP